MGSPPPASTYRPSIPALHHLTCRRRVFHRSVESPPPVGDSNPSPPLLLSHPCIFASAYLVPLPMSVESCEMNVPQHDGRITCGGKCRRHDGTYGIRMSFVGLCLQGGAREGKCAAAKTAWRQAETECL